MGCRKLWNRFKKKGAVTLLLALCATLPAGAFANPLGKPADSDQPIEISADSLEVVQPNRTATFRGNVVAVQGNIRLRADAMTAHYREAGDRNSEMGAVSRIEADGHVFLTTTEETARGTSAKYDVDNKKVNLYGDVVLTRGKNVLKGRHLVYDFATGRSLMTAGSDGKDAAGGVAKPGRVKALFVPSDKKAK